jgi:hypothetical protein
MAMLVIPVNPVKSLMLSAVLCAAFTAAVVHADKPAKKQSGAASIDEVATMIRTRTSWKILHASPRSKDSGNRYFRFKLLGSDGKVRIIYIDPSKPNLRKLE